MFGQNDKLYSWVDVQDRLLITLENDKWISGLKAEVFGSGIYIYHKKELPQNEIWSWLRVQFPNAIDAEKGLALESLGNGQRFLPVYLEETDEEDMVSPSFIPTFSRPKIITNEYEEVAPRPDNADPVMIAMHSFKGGVGRTLHALALASALESGDPNRRILLIDADFEAPGITWLISNPEISFIDVLNLIHSSTDPFSIVKEVAKDLENQNFDNVLILPAFRTDRQLRSLEIKPEHIFRFAENPFIISDVIAKLAQELNVGYVIVDLRAGISELSANWLLDPRVANIFVTTLNSQSVEGTLIVLDLLTKQHIHFKQRDTPAIIISQVNPDQAQTLQRIWNREEENSSGTAGQNIGKLRDAFTQYLSQVSLDEEDPLVVISPIYQNLLVLPNDWNAIKKLLQTSGLQENISTISSTYETSAPGEQSPSQDEIIGSRDQMMKILPDLVYAEKSLPAGFYRSQPIRNLASKHKTRLPNIVIIGAKGAGKTFLFRQILRANTWDNFLKEAVDEPSTSQVINAKVMEVTFPENIQDQPELWIKIIKPFIQEELESDKNLNDWRNIWLKTIAIRYGFSYDHPNSGDAFIKHLEEKKEQVIFIFDGLEDLFPNYYKNERQQIAIRSLLQDVQAYINATPNTPIGIITFIRRDIVEHVIKQNSGQFLDRYRDYELKWDRTEALRLVAWVMSHFEILTLTNLSNDDILQASEEQLTKALLRLWGRKLGGDKSREALAAKNILGKLSNFNQEVQSRDLVRFLAEAIKQEKSTTSTFRERLLSPRAIKDAFPEVGKAKISEVKEENRENDFRNVLEKLENITEEIKVPFESHEKLTPDDLRLLVEQGVIKRHADRYYMAELFRLGLGIDKRKGKVKTEFGGG